MTPYALIQSHPSGDFAFLHSTIGGKLIQSFSAMRSGWKLIRYGRTLYDTKSWFGIITGGFISAALTSIPAQARQFVIFGTRILLLVERIEAAFNQLDKTKKAWKELRLDYYRPSYHHAYNEEFIFDNKSNPVKGTYQKQSWIKLMAFRVTNLIVQVFTLINCYFDVIDALQFNNPELDFESVIQAPNNFFKSVKLLADNGDDFLQKWQAHRTMISKVLINLGMTVNGDSSKFEDNIKGSIYAAKFINKGVEFVQNQATKGLDRGFINFANAFTLRK